MIEIDKSKCDLCGTCVAVCPENVMGLTIYELEIDHQGCTRCSKCVWVCPVGALQLLPEKTPRPVEEI
ncbi:MAG: 4Fe-4S binding protein [Calditrichia bacterium]